MTTSLNPFEQLTEAELHALIERTDDPADLDAIIAAIAESSPTAWVRAMFPEYVPHGFAPHHEDLLDWAWLMEEYQRPQPFEGVWPRGGAKSTLAEIVCAMLGCRGTRHYGLYCCETQEQADDHVQNIGALLESEAVERNYPTMAARAVGKYGHSRAWRRNRLRTASGFTIDAIGLDTAARGVKMDEQRPDLIVIDDIDDPFDGPAIVRKKLDVLARTLLQAGAAHLATLVIQNLVHRDGVIAMISDGRAEILADRIQSGPIPAIEGSYAIEETGDPGRPWRIVGGEPTWPEGQGREACELKLADVGPTAWESEAQHKPRQLVGGMYEDVLPKVKHCTRDQLPDLVRKSIAVDPAVSDSDASDSHGVQCDGIDSDGVIYRLRSWEERATPGMALYTSIVWAYEEGVPEVLLEMNTGTDLSGRNVEQSWRKAFRDTDDQVRNDHPEFAKLPRRRVRKVRATASTGSKATRSSQMHADYERPGRIVHVIGDHEILEAALGRVFVVKPFDLADAAWYSWADLRGRIAKTGTTAGITGQM